MKPNCADERRDLRGWGHFTGAYTHSGGLIQDHLTDEKEPLSPRHHLWGFKQN